MVRPSNILKSITLNIFKPSPLPRFLDLRMGIQAMLMLHLPTSSKHPGHPMHRTCLVVGHDEFVWLFRWIRIGFLGTSMVALVAPWLRPNNMASADSDCPTYQNISNQTQKSSISDSHSRNVLNQNPLTTNPSRIHTLFDIDHSTTDRSKAPQPPANGWDISCGFSTPPGAVPSWTRASLQKHHGYGWLWATQSGTQSGHLRRRIQRIPWKDWNGGTQSIWSLKKVLHFDPYTHILSYSEMLPILQQLHKSDTGCWHWCQRLNPSGKGWQFCLKNTDKYFNISEQIKQPSLRDYTYYIHYGWWTCQLY